MDKTNIPVIIATLCGGVLPPRATFPRRFAFDTEDEAEVRHIMDCILCYQERDYTLSTGVLRETAVDPVPAP